MQAFVQCELGSFCDEELEICHQRVVSKEYEIVLLITPAAMDTGLVARTALPKLAVRNTGQLRGAQFDPIVVPQALTVRGRVLGPDGKSIEAELAFTPQREDSFVPVTVSTFTRSESGENVFEARLEPRTTYQVKVYPLGADDNNRPPPARFTLAADTTTRDFVYEQLVSFRARLVEETRRASDAGLRARLVSKAGEEVVSSVAYSDQDGGLELKVPPVVLEQLGSHRLMISARPAPGPWREVITFEGELLRPDISLTVPTVPAPVALVPTVEVSGRKLEADVTFTSKFSLVPDGEGDVNWCRLRAPSPTAPEFHCRASVTMSTSAAGELRAELLPGNYYVYISPKGELSTMRRVGTTRTEEQVRTQPDGGEQAGKVLDVEEATLFRGDVLGPSGRRMPGVAIRASALGVQRGDEEITRYNRSAETISDGRGAFDLLVDPGYYDLIATPPETSGFPTYVEYNRSISPSTGSSFTVRPQIPVIVRGTLVGEQRDGGSPAPLANATVEAYALVPSPTDRNARRTIRVARVSSDAMGKFALRLPSCIDAPNCPAAGTLDASVGSATSLEISDAGIRDATATPVRDASARALSDSGRTESGR